MEGNYFTILYWFCPMSQLFASGGQSIGVSASASVLPMNTQDWSPLGWTGWMAYSIVTQYAYALQHDHHNRSGYCLSFLVKRSPGPGHGNPLQYSYLENPHRQRSLAGYSPRGHKRIRHDWNDLACKNVPYRDSTFLLPLCILSSRLLYLIAGSVDLLFPTHTLTPNLTPLWQLSTCSPYLRICFCFAYSFDFFLDNIQVKSYIICLPLTDFT